MATDARFWVRAAVGAAAVAAVIAIPTRLIPTGWFSRMTPARPLDYVFLAATSILTGVLFALRSRGSQTQRVAVGSGLATVLAVGCPVCNKIVVAVLGVSGALSWFAPLQPVLGGAAVALLVYAIRRQLQTMAAPDECPVPAR